MSFHQNNSRNTNINIPILPWHSWLLQAKVVDPSYGTHVHWDMQSSESYLGKQFLRSEGQEGEQENQTMKTKNAPVREGVWLNMFSKQIGWELLLWQVGLIVNIKLHFYV